MSKKRGNIFWALYIEQHCVNILYLYFENTLSIYRKVAIGFFTLFTVSSEEVYTFYSFKSYKYSLGSIISAICGEINLSVLGAIRLDKTQE